MEIKELKVCGKAWNLEEAFYNLTIAEMDSIIKQGNFQKNATSLLIHCEPNSDAEKFGMQLRDRGQKRRWKAQQDAKLAEQEIK